MASGTLHVLMENCVELIKHFYCDQTLFYLNSILQPMQKTEMCALEGEKETCERPQSRQHPLPQHQVRLVLVSLGASLDRFKTGKY